MDVQRILVDAVLDDLLVLLSRLERDNVGELQKDVSYGMRQMCYYTERNMNDISDCRDTRYQ